MTDMHIYATPPDLQTLTIADSIKAMSPAPIYSAEDIAIAPPAIFVTIVAPIPNPEFTGWVYIALGKGDSYQYFCEENLIQYDSQFN